MSTTWSIAPSTSTRHSLLSGSRIRLTFPLPIRFPLRAHVIVCTLCCSRGSGISNSESPPMTRDNGSHTCCKCHKSSSIRCLCCPNAVCERCITNNEEFSRVGGVYGICDECLKLALMVEEGRDVDSEGEAMRKDTFASRNQTWTSKATCKMHTLFCLKEGDKRMSHFLS